MSTEKLVTVYIIVVERPGGTFTMHGRGGEGGVFYTTDHLRARAEARKVMAGRDGEEPVDYNAVEVIGITGPAGESAEHIVGAAVDCWDRLVDQVEGESDVGEEREEGEARGTQEPPGGPGEGQGG